MKPWPGKSPRWYYNWFLENPHLREKALARLRQVEPKEVYELVEYYLNDEIMERKGK